MFGSVLESPRLYCANLELRSNNIIQLEYLIKVCFFKVYSNKGVDAKICLGFTHYRGVNPK